MIPELRIRNRNGQQLTFSRGSCVSGRFDGGQNSERVLKGWGAGGAFGVLHFMFWVVVGLTQGSFEVLSGSVGHILLLRLGNVGLAARGLLKHAVNCVPILQSSCLLAFLPRVLLAPVLRVFRADFGFSASASRDSVGLADSASCGCADTLRVFRRRRGGTSSSDTRPPGETGWERVRMVAQAGREERKREKCQKHAKAKAKVISAKLTKDESENVKEERKGREGREERGSKDVEVECSAVC